MRYDMSIIVSEIDNEFDDIVDKIVNDVFKESKSLTRATKTTEEIIYDHTCNFVQNMTVRDIIKCLTYVRTIDEDMEIDTDIRKSNLKTELFNVVWNIQDLISELIKERM